jgi:hypothetical protein
VQAERRPKDDLILNIMTISTEFSENRHCREEVWEHSALHCSPDEVAGRLHSFVNTKKE